MLNLAPFRYGAIGSEEGGPIERLSLSQVDIAGEHCYRAGAKLRGEFTRSRGSRQIFGTADGSGTDRSALLARYKAISEALERWAFHALFAEKRESECGLELDPTSSGMAAFPGLWKRQARVRARREAIERWCLVEWWSGRLDHCRAELPYPGQRGIEIENPMNGDRVVLLWSKLNCGLYAYGYSAGKSLREAGWKALAEQQSCADALAVFQEQHPAPDAAIIGRLENELERRVVHYALLTGHNEFRERLNRRPQAVANRGDLIFDQEIRGPWSCYATVWRVICRTSDNRHHDPDQLTFFW